MNSSVIFLLCAILGIQAANVNSVDNPHFRCDYTYNTKAEGWLKLHEVPATWHDARLICQLEGATLASPTTPGLALAIRNLQTQILNTTVTDKKAAIDVYTGIHSTYAEGTYASLEGIPLSMIQHSWAKGSPYVQGDCLIMTSDGGLAVVDGEEAKYPFVCYKKLEELNFTECGTYDKEYTLNSKLGKCYKFHSNTRSWSKAYLTCVAEGAQLAIVNSEEEATFIRTLAADKEEPITADGYAEYTVIGDVEEKKSKKRQGSKDSNVVHVGFSFPESSKWMAMTIDGQTLKQAGYTKLSAQQRTSRGSCGGLDNKGNLVNVRCHKMWQPFVCEKIPKKDC